MIQLPFSASCRTSRSGHRFPFSVEPDALAPVGSAPLRSAPATALALALLAATVLSSAPPCAAQAPGGGPQNVILFVLDDTSSSDFPFLNQPVQWESEDDPLKSRGPSPEQRILEAALREPTLNRLGARMFADGASCPGEDCGKLGQRFSNGAMRTVVPIDLDAGGDESVATFRYEPGAGGENCLGRDVDLLGPAADDCPTYRDVLSGFGGLGTLASDGVVFPRFYASSVLCSPTRAALVTGRHPESVGVSSNKRPLERSQLTIADYLKRLCDDGDPDTPCYTNGLLGKWHLRSRSSWFEAPWQRGFDEALYFKGASRPHWRTGELACNPVESPKSGFCEIVPEENLRCEAGPD